MRKIILLLIVAILLFGTYNSIMAYLDFALKLKYEVDLPKNEPNQAELIKREKELLLLQKMAVYTLFSNVLVLIYILTKRKQLLNNK